MDVLLSYEHLDEFKKYCKEKVIKQEWLHKNVFKDKEGAGIDQSQVSRRIKNKNVSYLDVSRLIKALSDEGDDEDKIKPFRRILAEHIVDEIHTRWPELGFSVYTFPFLRKVNLSDITEISMLKKYMVRCYLEALEYENIGLSENLIVPNMDYQSLDYFEGYISALVYFLPVLRGAPSCCNIPLTINLINQSLLPYIINLMGSFNKMLCQTTAFDKDNPTEYDKDIFNVQWDINIIELSESLKDMLLRLCPARQSKLFYAGWAKFCVFFCGNFITETGEDALLYLKKIEYSLLNSLDYCLDKFMEKRDNLVHTFWKKAYDFLILKLEKGYEEAEKEMKQFANDVNEVSLETTWKSVLMGILLYNENFKDEIENILLCFCNKKKGARVAINLLFSNLRDEPFPFEPLIEWEYTTKATLKYREDQRKSQRDFPKSLESPVQSNPDEWSFPDFKNTEDEFDARNIAIGLKTILMKDKEGV